jgi:hypothetical protein
MEGALLLTPLLTAGPWLGLRGLNGLGEDVGGGGLGGADHVGVDPERDGWVGVAEPGRDDVDRDAGQQQGRGVEVPQVVQSGVRQRVLRPGPSSGRLCAPMSLVISEVTVSG